MQDSFLGDLVSEISMQTAATEATYAAAQATATTALQISKDQYIRLNADFDNFRRRTVDCTTAACSPVVHDLVMHARHVQQCFGSSCKLAASCVSSLSWNILACCRARQPCVFSALHSLLETDTHTCGQQMPGLLIQKGLPCTWLRGLYDYITQSPWAESSRLGQKMPYWHSKAHHTGLVWPVPCSM